MVKNVEIELKLPLLNGSEVEKFLAKNAEYKYESNQHDLYFNPPHRDFLANKDNVNEWLRIRLSGDKAQINYKDWQPHDKKLKTHCQEFETNVDSYEQLDEILKALNFIKLIEVKKLRKVWLYKDAEVSIDSVEGLGQFIEVEYKGDLQDIELARKYLFDILIVIGAKTRELDVRGYPYLLLEKKGLM
jgi:adenylate cyclase class 2